ncbi:hypothetical protein D3C78_773310 [compost metagenome]
MRLLEQVEFLAVLAAMNGGGVVSHQRLKMLFIRFELGDIIRGDALAFLQTQHFLSLQITVDPGAANHRTVIKPGHRIVTHTVFTGLDLQQP